MEILCECNVTDIEFSAGSVVVSFVLNVAVDTTEASLLAMLQDAAIAGTLISGYDVAASDVIVEGATPGYLVVYKKIPIFCYIFILF